jgi:hypothetical protein
MRFVLQVLFCCIMFYYLPLLFFKIDRELWPVIKSFVVYLGRLPEFPKSALHEIPLDDNCLKSLDSI